MPTTQDKSTDQLEQKAPELSIDIVEGTNRGAHWTLDKESVSIGRGLENDVILGEDSHVSRSHFELNYLNGHWTVSDSDSCNGAYMKLSSQFFRIVNCVDIYQSSLLQIGKTSLSLKWAA